MSSEHTADNDAALPTAQMVKRPRRGASGKPSESRRQQVRDRLADSPFVRDDTPIPSEVGEDQ